MFIDLIPFPGFREYPPHFMYSSGAILMSFIVMFWTVLFGVLLHSELNDTYSAPARNPLRYSAATCEDRIVPNTGSYLATRSGLWEGAKGFDYADASYSLTASSWKMGQDYYMKAMKRLQRYLNSVGQITAKSDLGTNLLYWFSLIGVADLTNFANRFTLVGDPSVTFNRQNVYGTISSVAGECVLSGQTSNFEKANGVLRMTVPLSEYKANSICKAAGDPTYLGYNEYLTGDSFDIKVDVRSIVTALSINLKILTLNRLVEVKAFRSNYTFADGSQTIISQYFNPKFPGMTPVLCVVDGYCFVKVGPASFAVPFFHHIGNSTELPERCDCSKMSSADLKDAYHLCNRFLFLTGFYFFPSDSVEPLWEFALRDAIHSHKASFQSSFTASSFGLSSPHYEHFKDPQVRSDMYKFCQTSLQNCTMVTFSLYDMVNPDWAISDHYYQLTTGACQDQITATADNWQALIDNPFSSLTADYQECANGKLYTFLVQLGSSLGTLDFIIPISLLLTFFILAVYQKVTGERIPRVYKREEKDSALQALAVTLLLARDRKRVKLMKTEEEKMIDSDDEEDEETDLADAKNPVVYKLIDELAKDSVYHSDSYELKKTIENYHNDYLESRPVNRQEEAK